MNLPNKITVCRLVLIPVFVFFYLANFIPYGKLVAGIVFAIACLTDFLDGYIARKYNLVTTLGKFLDSIADKVLVMSGLLCLVAYPIVANGGVRADAPAIFPTYVGIVAGIVILARELLISAFRQLAASKNIVLAADMCGKVKACFQFITLIFYFVYAFIVEEFYYAIDGVPNTALNITGYILLAITIALTIASAFRYIALNRQVLKDSNKS